MRVPADLAYMAKAASKPLEMSNLYAFPFPPITVFRWAGALHDLAEGSAQHVKE